MRNHNKNNQLLSAVGIAALTMFVTNTAAAQGLALGQDRAAVSKSDFGQARGRNTNEKVQNFLGARGKDRATQRSIALRGEHKDGNGRSFARYEQRVNGLRVHGAYVKAAFDSEGEMIHFIERLAPANSRINTPIINDETALRLAIEENFDASVSAPGLLRKEGAVATFSDNDFFYKGPSVERVIVARGNALEEGFLVETWSNSDNLLYHTLIDSTGQVVSSELRTAQDSYNIFPIHPGVTPQSVANGAGAGNAQSPQGWLSGGQSTRQISGNNVSAYLDQDSNNTPDGGGVSVTDGNFLTAANLGQDPRNGTNPDVSVQNIFYFSNIAHDRLYTHGFVEATGNFQENNFGNGGAGSDSLNAEALDGSGTNNANFATPADGSNPRMQMFRTTLANPNRDTGIDSDVVWHEYGHGLTWRMIGNMSGSVSGALGEGASDTLAIIITDEDRVGEWSFNDTNGIRSSRYEGHPNTLGDFAGNSVHADGEIYAAAMWDVFSLYKANGLTADDMLDDFVGGMNFTPAGPNYIDMRDGLLAQASADRDCLIWEAYAGHGMGEGASMVIRTGGNPRNRININESFAVPSVCDGGTPPPPPPPAGDVSLAELTGVGTSQGRNRWRAIATASIIDDTGTAVSGISVSGSWSTGDNGSCTTDTSGSCSVELSGLRNNRVASVTFTATSIDGDTGAGGIPASVTINRP